MCVCTCTTYNYKYTHACTHTHTHTQRAGEELTKHVKQARDALVLYALEESDSSGDEQDLDQYLQTQIDEYIDSKTAKRLIEVSPCAGFCGHTSCVRCARAVIM
jgi:hypothetical protein